MLAQSFGWRGDESAEEQLKRLERSLELAGLKPAEAAAADCGDAESADPGEVSAADARARPEAPAAAGDAGRVGAWRRPSAAAVIAIEDLHWADPSTLELIQLLVEQGATAPLMLLYTARPEFRAPWPMRAHHAQITLNRLSARRRARWWRRWRRGRRWPEI